MKETISKSVDSAVQFLKEVSPVVPRAAIVLGSGVQVLEALEGASSYPYDKVFGIAPGVVGHQGSLTIGRLPGSKDKTPIAVLRGRFHLYEGHDWSVVTLPTRVLIEWGVPVLLLTNAAGGLNKAFEVGDLMVLTGYRDHLNPKYQETGLLPAIKASAVDCKNKLTERLVSVGESLVKEDKTFKPLRKGVYAGLLGPNYETMAEIEMLRRLNADAVGMSTVPELQTAHGTKTEAAAVSVITNVWEEDKAIGGHEEVLEASKQASKRLDKLFTTLLA